MNTDKTAVTGGRTAARDEWQYMGDVNIEYGGTFFNLSDDWDNGYVSAVRVTDLDSGCGFVGAVLIEKITILVDDDKTNESACDCCGWIKSEVDTTTESGKLQLAEAVMSYGRYDPADEYYEPANEVVQTQEDGPMEFDGWKASKRVLSENLRGYVESKLN